LRSEVKEEPPGAVTRSAAGDTSGARCPIASIRYKPRCPIASIRYKPRCPIASIRYKPRYPIAAIRYQPGKRLDAHIGLPIPLVSPRHEATAAISGS